MARRKRPSMVLVVFFAVIGTVEVFGTLAGGFDYSLGISGALFLLGAVVGWSKAQGNDYVLLDVAANPDEAEAWKELLAKAEIPVRVRFIPQPGRARHQGVGLRPDQECEVKVRIRDIDAAHQLLEGSKLPPAHAESTD